MGSWSIFEFGENIRFTLSKLILIVHLLLLLIRLLNVRIIRCLCHVLVVVLILLFILGVFIIVVSRKRCGEHILFILLNYFDVGRVDLHIRRAVIKNSGRHIGHWVYQLTQLIIAMSKATIDAEFANTISLKVLAILSLVVTMEYTDILFSWETFW